MQALLKPYTPPVVIHVGTLLELTQGLGGSQKPDTQTGGSIVS